MVCMRGLGSPTSLNANHHARVGLPSDGGRAGFLKTMTSLRRCMWVPAGRRSKSGSVKPLEKTGLSQVLLA